MQKYVENLYKVLFENDFSEIKSNTTMFLAAGTLCLSSLFLFFSKQTIAGNLLSDAKIIAGLFGYLCAIFLFWLISALFFEFVAKIFGKSGKIRTLLVLSSFTFLPYIFMPPLELMKEFSSMGYFFGTRFEILLFLWVIFLYASALKETYDIEKTSSFMFIILPIISLFFAFIWLIGSCFNFGYIYSV